MAKDINYSHVKYKVVEPEVVRSVNDITIANESDYGKLSVVMPTDSNNNAIYVGGEHVASGYGFDNLSVKQSVIELIENENIQKIARGENSQQQSNPTPDDSGITEIVETIDDSDIFYNGERIKIENGKLGKELYENDHTWIEISNVKVKIKKNEQEFTITSLDYQTFSIFDDIIIKSIEFDYILNKESILSNIYYTIDQNNNLNHKYSLTELTNSDIYYERGEKKHFNINDLNIIINKDTDNDLKTINLYFSDQQRNNIIYIPICNFKFIYLVFGLINSIEESDFLEELNNSLSDNAEFIEAGSYINDNNEYLIKVGSNNVDSYHYILIPSKYPEDKISIILKSSNIGCTFEVKEVYSVNNIYYKIYKSPKSYIGQLYWIIKIW